MIVLGIHVSLRNPSSRHAIANTLGTVFFLSVGTLISIYLIVINGGSFANQWVSFISFLVLGIGGLLLRAECRPTVRRDHARKRRLPARDVLLRRDRADRASPGTDESADPLMPFLALGGSFGSPLRRCWSRC